MVGPNFCSRCRSISFQFIKVPLSIALLSRNQRAPSPLENGYTEDTKDHESLLFGGCGPPQDDFVSEVYRTKRKRRFDRRTFSGIGRELNHIDVLVELSF